MGEEKGREEVGLHFREQRKNLSGMKSTSAGKSGEHEEGGGFRDLRDLRSASLPIRQ